MSELSTLDFFDPRGRVNRRGFIIFAAVLIGAQAGLYGALIANGGAFHTGLSNLINAVLFWMGYVAVSKRLHDFGFSAWRLAAALAGMAIWCFALSFTLVGVLGEDGFEPGGAGWIAAAAGTLLPLAGMTLWIHCGRGDAAPNRFGPAPGASGLSRAHPPVSAQSATQPPGSLAAS